MNVSRLTAGRNLWSSVALGVPLNFSVLYVWVNRGHIGRDLKEGEYGYDCDYGVSTV